MMCCRSDVQLVSLIRDRSRFGSVRFQPVSKWQLWQGQQQNPAVPLIESATPRPGYSTKYSCSSKCDCFFDDAGHSNHQFLSWLENCDMNVETQKRASGFYCSYYFNISEGHPSTARTFAKSRSDRAFEVVGHLISAAARMFSSGYTANVGRYDGMTKYISTFAAWNCLANRLHTATSSLCFLDMVIWNSRRETDLV